MAFDPEAVRSFEHARWQQAASAYELSFATATTPFIGALLDAGGVVAGTQMLDIACGPGVVAAQAMARGAVVRSSGLLACHAGHCRRPRHSDR